MSAPASDRNANILVVDDEPSARAALVELLRDEGYAVRGAADGFKALGQLDHWNADVVITDVCMPGMDGLELMQRVHERDEHIGVVVMTGHGSLENAMEAMDEGAEDYITKPVQLPELLGVLHEALASHALRRENERLEQGVVVETVAPGVEWVGECNGREIEPRQLPREAMQHGAPIELPAIPGASLAELERYAILKTLEHVRGSTSKAAEILGISPRKIQYRLAEYRGTQG